jgi:Zn-dependent alcohol dehydrogenase
MPAAPATPDAASGGARVKLLKTVRADPSDTFVFDKAAEPGEWAVSGAFMFAQLDPATLTGKARAAFRAGFLGIGSFGWSTLARIVEASEENRAAAVEQLAARLVERFGAPDLMTARPAAEEEIVFAASLCDHPAGMLVAVSRRYENEVTRETFRTLQSNGRSKPAPVFTFLQVADEAEAPPEQIDFTALANGERR